MKIMVTGGAGFIGSHVVDGYIESGHDVLVVDDLSTGKRSNVHPEARFFELDIRSPETAGLIKSEVPQAINHHAAQASVPFSVAEPRNDADINIQGFINILEAAVKGGVEKVIFISSGGAVYGDARQYPTAEGCAPEPLSPYAVSKFASEKYLAFYRHQYGLSTTVLRYANIYGPRQAPHGEAGVVAIFMENILSGRDSILYQFPDDAAGMIRDYCYVGDVVKANLKALHRETDGCFNIGSGKETRTLALYETIWAAIRETKPDLPRSPSMLNRRPARPGDIPRSCLIVDKARGALGWGADTDVKTGVRHTLAWCLQPGNHS
ncbi:MAG: NAD-dependent epimerase/dehydratase family protein [Deltaproteobacteria bacterium]|nr:NAD-dependent epimerase/dehydratase family protein [Deltaproteobacteria bacterium]MBW2285123.1 NAD-dependent epimerase/dehydratase family protein [Deltaproteobacteria bacterium]